MTRRGAASIAASPVLVGAVTVLVTAVAVFIAYNANQGLPFVPTYKLAAEVPSGSKLVPGNAVRIGGFRVGQVSALRTKVVRRDGRPRNIAVIEMELETRVKPLPADTLVTVRPRSALGLKYVELHPGDSERALVPGATIPLRNARRWLELEDVLDTFQPEVRVDSRDAIAGYGNAFAGRGPSLNETIASLPELLVHLTPVMRTLSAPRTELDEFFKQIGRAAAQVAPVARTQAVLFANMADTFAAFSRDPAALQATIEKSPPTLRTAVRSFRVQRPFLRELALLSRELVPATAELPRSLPGINVALRTGQPVLRATPQRLNRPLARTFRALDDLAERPTTLLALRDLDRTIDAAQPLVSFIAPYQTVCNYFNYFLTPLGGHLSQEVRNGTIERVMLVTPNQEQDNTVAGYGAERPADVPAGEDPQEATTADGSPLTRLGTQFYGPAVDENGKADCQAGQTGYPDGPLITTGRYPPDTAAGGFAGGGSHVMLDSDTPGRRGGTYKSRELGIDGLEDVP